MTISNQSGSYPSDPLLPDATLPTNTGSSGSSKQSLGQTTPPAIRARRFDPRVLWIIALATLLGVGLAITMASGDPDSPTQPPRTPVEAPAR